MLVPWKVHGRQSRLGSDDFPDFKKKGDFELNQPLIFQGVVSMLVVPSHLKKICSPRFRGRKSHQNLCKKPAPVDI